MNGFARAAILCKSMIFPLFLIFFLLDPMPTPDCGYCLSGNKLSFSSSYFSDGNAGDLPPHLGMERI